jgi:hypothetical protein
MCQSCIEFKRIERLRNTLVRPETDAAELDGVHRLIYALYGERVRSHENPESK